MKRLLLALAFAGCAQAGSGNTILDAIIDASPITLSQTQSAAVLDNNSVACGNADLDVTRPNSYYRVFPLADHGITTTLHVTQVAFAIQDASAGVGTTQPATLQLGTYAVVPTGDTLDLGAIRSLTSVAIDIADGRNTEMTVPVTADVPAATNLIVELAIPENNQVKHLFFIGSNRDGERRPGYLYTPTCPEAGTSPTVFRRFFSDHDINIVMTVTGTM